MFRFSGVSAMRRVAESLVLSLPESLARRLVPRRFTYAAEDVPPVPHISDAPIRLYIAPANFAGQGYAWARAAELIPGVRAANLEAQAARGFDFPADFRVPDAVFQKSLAWQRAHFRAAASTTHLLIEAERSLFGSRFAGDVLAEVTAMRDRGVRVGFVSHGTDLRVPRIHREAEAWSPFRDDDWDEIPELERRTRANLRLLAAADAPVFVSGPSGLAFWPDAEWLPVAIDPARWERDDDALRRRTLRVVHVPSRGRVKGTHLIEPAIQPLVERGVIDYRRVEGIPSGRMPEVYGDADVVLDSFRTGGYGVAACEALAAGRLVVSYLGADVRSHLRTTRGVEIPIVQADPGDIAQVLEDIAADRDSYRHNLSAGRAFVASLHDGRESSRVLAPFLEAGASE